MAERTWAIISGGGTGGHLLPGIAVARALVAAGHDPEEIHFVGASRGPEGRLVPEAGFTVDLLGGRGLDREGKASRVGTAWATLRAVVRGIGIVRRHRPAVVVGLGGYASVPGVVGAIVTRTPVVLLEQNIVPGSVNRKLGRWAKRCAVSFEGTDLPDAVVTGNPLRPEIRAQAEHRDVAAARAALELPEDRTVIAVFAGSQGSAHINGVLAELVPRWADRSDLAIRHVLGKNGFPDHVEAPTPPPATGLCYQVVGYEDRMDLLLGAADLCVARSGGGVFEVMAIGVPAILVPFPFAADDHQMANARAVAAGGGAVVLEDRDLDVDRLAAEIEALLSDRGKLADMAAAMRSGAVIDAAEQVVAVVEQVARG